MESIEEIQRQARKIAEEISAEHARLEGSVPYGLFYQVPIETLRALKTPEEGRAFYEQWKKGGISAKGKTDLRLNGEEEN